MYLYTYSVIYIYIYIILYSPNLTDTMFNVLLLRREGRGMRFT